MGFELKGYSFEGPFSSATYLEDEPGVFAVLCRQFEKNHLVDIDEAENVRTRIDDHENSGCWRRNCESSLIYAVLYTPGLDSKERENIVDEIRDEYNPVCGEL